MRTLSWLSLIFLLSACAGDSDNSAAIKLADVPAADGRWQIINYWATWCAPCREEIPELNHFHYRFSDKAAVYGVNFDGATGEELIVQSAELGIEFIQLRSDPAAALGYDRPNVLPTTMIINPQGEIVRVLVGPQTESTLLDATGLQ